MCIAHCVGARQDGVPESSGLDVGSAAARLVDSGVLVFGSVEDFALQHKAISRIPIRKMPIPEIFE